MSTIHLDDEGRPLRAQVHSGARVSVERPPASGDAWVTFEDDTGSLHVLLALDVFPRLVDMIQFSGLAEHPRGNGIRGRLSPSEGARPGLMAPKAPGEGDRA